MPVPKETRLMLESDDEFSDVSDGFEEDVELPAYKDDGRFKPIEFPWLQHKSIRTFANDIKNARMAEQSLLILQNYHKNLFRKTSKLKKNKRAVIDCGVLSKQDLFCLRQIEPCLTDIGVMWFVDYLKHNDMLKVHAKYYTNCLAIEPRPSSRYEQEDQTSKKLYKFSVDVI